MARRGGKANTRRSRQRRNQQHNRPAGPPSASAQRPAFEAAKDAAVSEAATSGGSDAFDKADAEVRAASRAAQSAPSPRAGAPRRMTSSQFGMAGPSRLSERAAAEYHYVARDLRNIGVLVAIMVVLLAAATILVNVLGIGPG